MANSLNAFMENHEKVEIDATKKVRVGIIGCGWIAESHMASYLKQPDVEIVAGCDLVPGKAEVTLLEGVNLGVYLAQRLIIHRAIVLATSGYSSAVKFPFQRSSAR